MTFTIVQNDTAPPISSRLADSGVPIDLSNASNVRFHMENNKSEVIVNDDQTGSVNIVDVDLGEVEYVWRSEDTDQPGTYYAEWQVLYDDGKIETFPSSRKIRVEIVEGIE